MKRQTKLTSQEQEQLAAQEHQQQQASSAQEFNSAEEMLRHDALHTPVPPRIAQRLDDSISQLPPPPGRAWWRRLLGP
jgi:hypothetical protein